MPKLSVFSGKQLIALYEQFGFSIVAQKGSHIKVRRVLTDGTKQSLTIPNHKEIDRGTLKSIYNKTLQYIPEDELKSHFYTS